MTLVAPNRRPTPMQAHRLQRGMTMIESLVAIVVLSFGMLGVVGLQAAALQSNKEARYQASAVRLAKELGELLRGNKNIAIEAASSDNPYLVTFNGTLPTTSLDCYASACSTPKEVAEYQIVEWLGRVDAELPGARVTVCVDDESFDSGGLPVWDCSDAGGTVVVKIGWTQTTTDHGATGSLGAGSSTPGLARATRPGVVVALIAGSSE